ncbi:biotin--[acetyl-CoA-carboxylase] ligase [Desulfuribacillus alkaliarsenatis]|uniref:Bifunctional ligase/repressor BirA n=2 Tax=Desulfuribacillus alkaliarsenatis TaxID=766136 RepID=A0A1E5G6G9_9FIRM|nr:biotin--[acetyl-CoA-carboxylase] ligase [Desulfuribacillus alkaliarsenatis]
MNTKSLILQQLKNATDYISGEEISNQLNISRTAVWKHIQELKKAGYNINSYTKKGYILTSSPDSIANEEITPNLKTAQFGSSYIYHHSIDSTNISAKFLAEQGAKEGTVVSAEEQTKGKGRLGRLWQSPVGQGLYFSIIVRPQIPVYLAPQITLVVASVIAKVLNEKYNLHAVIKWPNDILVDSKKLAGILVEMSSDIDRINYAVLGIGINVNNPEAAFTKTDTKYQPTSMFNELKTKINRSELLTTLLAELEIAYHTFIESGFNTFKPIWESYAFSINKQIQVTTANQSLTGTLTGIDESGALLLEINGEKHTIHSGEIIL